MYGYKIGCFVGLILASIILIDLTSRTNSTYFGIALSIFLFWLFKGVFYTSEEQKRKNVERNKQYDEAREKKEQQKLLALEELKNMKIYRMQTEWEKYYKRHNFSFVDDLSGLEFEEFLLKILKEMDYLDARLTNEIGDQGIDILFTDFNGEKVGVQAKRYSGGVGNSAVQQLLGGMLYYNCEKGIIATSSKFTEAAIKLANKEPRIELWSRKKIEELYYDAIPSEIPSFSVERAKQIGLHHKIKLMSSEINQVLKKYGLDDRYDFKYFDIDI